MDLGIKRTVPMTSVCWRLALHQTRLFSKAEVGDYVEIYAVGPQKLESSSYQGLLRSPSLLSLQRRSCKGGRAMAAVKGSGKPVRRRRVTSCAPLLTATWRWCSLKASLRGTRCSLCHLHVPMTDMQLLQLSQHTTRSTQYSRTLSSQVETIMKPVLELCCRGCR